MFASLQLVPGNFDFRKDNASDMFTYDMQFTARPFFSYLIVDQKKWRNNPPFNIR